MSLENEGIAIPGEGGEPAASTPSTRNDAPAGGDDTEARARAMGWVPQEDFRGPADKWRDATEFVRRGEEDLPIVRERLRDTTRKLTQLEQRLNAREAEFQTNYQSLERMTTVALDRQRQQIADSYAAAARAAVEVGDVTRYDQLQRDQQQALQQFDNQSFEAREVPKRQAQQAQQAAQQQLPAEEVPIVEGWRQSNPWFLHDAEMNMVAQQAHVRIGRENPDLPLAENLKRVTAYIQQRYPEKFNAQQAAPMRGSTVEGGSRVPSAGGAMRGKGAGELPQEARRQGDKYVKQGLFKDINEYAKEYWSQE